MFATLEILDFVTGAKTKITLIYPTISEAWINGTDVVYSGRRYNGLNDNDYIVNVREATNEESKGIGELREW